MKYPLKYALEIAEKVKDKLAPYCERIEIAGSVRRRKQEVKDIEIVLIRRPKDIWDLNCLVNKWKKVKGEVTGKYTQRLLPEGIKLDLFVAVPENWGLQLAIRTGPAEYSRDILAAGWSKKGYYSKGGILYPTVDPENGNPVCFFEEKELFDFLGLEWKEPWERGVNL